MDAFFEFKTYTRRDRSYWRATSLMFVRLSQVCRFETVESNDENKVDGGRTTILYIHVLGEVIEIWDYDEGEFEAFKNAFHNL